MTRTEMAEPYRLHDCTIITIGEIAVTADGSMQKHLKADIDTELI